MAKKNFLLLSLNDDKAKKIANVVNNDSCSKILDYLSDREATETEIVKDLKLPASTVNYNLKQLLDSRLIVWEKSHRSEKGKEVKHYTVANRYVIIAPKGSTKEEFLEKIKSIIPAFVVAVLGAGVLQFSNLFRSEPQMMQSAMLMKESSLAADTTAMALPEITSTSISSEPNIALWFLFGAFTVLVFSLIFSFLRKR